jgi:cobalt transporter subunit CbtA
MSVFRSIVFSAALSGLIVGAVITAAQLVSTIPLIQKAETYERKAEAAPEPAAHEHAGHDHGDHDHAVHSHAAEWEPADGLQRNAFTAGANVLTAIGYAMLLAGIFALKSGAPGWREGLFWGLGGFVVFTLAPGLGLPPELPGIPAAELEIRQVWWIATAVATALGLCLLFFRRAPWAAMLGLGLIALPHLIGAPQAAEAHTDVPEALSHSFVVAVTLTSLLFWTLLGVSTSIAFQRISRS